MGKASKSGKGKGGSGAVAKEREKAKAKAATLKERAAAAKAREKEKEATHAEHKALRFDFGEGLLEIGLVLSSLYFISRRMLFPVIGIVAGLAGIVIAAGGFMVQ